jgi:hypothetical protein
MIYERSEKKMQDDQVDQTEPTQESTLTARQEKAIVALLSQPTIKQAAAAAEVSEVTLHRWLKEPGFHKAFMEARWKGVEQAIAKLQRSTSNAAAVLDSLANDEAQPASIRLAAAKSIIYNAFRGVELEDHDVRLSEIHDQITETNSMLKEQGL